MLLNNRRTLRHVALGLTLAASLTGCRCPQIKMPKWPWMPYTPSTRAPTSPSPVPSASPPEIGEPIPEASLPPLESSPGPELAPAPLAPPAEEPEERPKSVAPAPKSAPLPLPPPKSKTTQKSKGAKVADEGTGKPEEPRPLQTSSATRWRDGLARKTSKSEATKVDSVSDSDDSFTSESEPEVSSKAIAPQNRSVQLPKKDDPWRSQSDVKLPEIPPHRLKKSEQAQPAPQKTASTEGLPTLSAPEPVRKRVTTNEETLPKGHTPSAQIELETPASDGPSLIPSPSPYQAK